MDSFKYVSTYALTTIGLLLLAYVFILVGECVKPDIVSALGFGDIPISQYTSNMNKAVYMAMFKAVWIYYVLIAAAVYLIVTATSVLGYCSDVKADIEWRKQLERDINEVIDRHSA